MRLELQREMNRVSQGGRPAALHRAQRRANRHHVRRHRHAQIDDVQQGWFHTEFDLTDVPRDQFLVGGEAWRRFRAGEADPARFGLSQLPEAGDWWIAANLMRDGAALLNVELLPWDCWGAMPTPADAIGDDLAGFFDHLAEVTLAPDDHLPELRQLYCDERLRVARIQRVARDMLLHKTRVRHI